MTVQHLNPRREPIRTIPSVLAGRVVAPETIAGVATSIRAVDALDLARDLKSSANLPDRDWLAFVQAARAWENLADALASCELANLRAGHTRPSGRMIHLATIRYAVALDFTERLYA